MERLINTDLICAVIERLVNDSATAPLAMDMQLQLVDVLVPLQLHVQRAALIRAKSEGAYDICGISLGCSLLHHHWFRHMQNMGARGASHGELIFGGVG